MSMTVFPSAVAFYALLGCAAVSVVHVCLVYVALSAFGLP